MAGLDGVLDYVSESEIVGLLRNLVQTLMSRALSPLRHGAVVT